MENVPVTKVGIFIDGRYLNRVSKYYSEEPGLMNHIDYRGLVEFLRLQTASIINKKQSSVVVSLCNFYIGMPERSSFGRLMSIKQSLLEVGVSYKVFPNKKLPDGSMKEQGVDVALAFDAGMATNLDIIVLITGDGDFIPLLDGLQGMAKKTVILAYWNIGERVRANQELIKTAKRKIDMNVRIRLGLEESDKTVLKIFGLKKEKAPEEEAPPVEERCCGIILELEQGKFIRPLHSNDLLKFSAAEIEPPGADTKPFFKGQLVDFTLIRRGRKKENEAKAIRLAV